jgi:hypothetical protein
MHPNDEKFSEIINLLNNGYPIRVIAKQLHVNIYYIRKICEENNIPILDKREALKRAKRLALGVKKPYLEPINFPYDELLLAAEKRMDYLFKADFSSYNEVERKFLFRILFASFPSNLQEKLLAYTLTLMGKGKFTRIDIARAIQTSGLLKNINLETLIQEITLWMNGAHPLRMKSNIKYIRGDLEYAIGILLGDGHVPKATSNRKTMFLYNHDRDVANHFSLLLDKMGIKNKVYIRVSRGEYAVAFNNLIIYYLLRAILDNSEVAKMFGEFLYMFPDLAWRFLQGMADAEGCVSISTTEFGDPSIRISIANTNPTLLELCLKCFEANDVSARLAPRNVVVYNKNDIIKCHRDELFYLNNKRRYKLRTLIKTIYNKELP